MTQSTSLFGAGQNMAITMTVKGCSACGKDHPITFTPILLGWRDEKTGTWYTHEGVCPEKHEIVHMTFDFGAAFNAPGWRKALSPRELLEVEFCLTYLEKFNHGTDGHILRGLIAKLAYLLDRSTTWTLDTPDGRKQPVKGDSI